MNRITRIEIYPTIKDNRAANRKKKFLHFSPKIKNVTIADVYTIDKSFTENELIQIATMLTNKITQKYIIKTSNSPSQSQIAISHFSYALEIGFLPGVTDNVATTTRESIEDLLRTNFAKNENVYTSQITYIDGALTEKELTQIASILYNPLIQRETIKSRKQFEQDNGMDFVVPKVILHNKPSVTEVNLNIPVVDLLKIGKSGIPNPDGSRRGPLALDLKFMKTIQKYFKDLGRNPTDIELESLAQTWSEHCKHTVFADPIDDIQDGLYKTYIKKATQVIRKKKGKKDFCVSVFTDNSGGISFDTDYIVSHKVETHNSPSALDPFGGAITGIVGVNRDAIGFGMGAKPIANFYGFCFADPEKDIPLYKDAALTQKMLSSRRIMDGVIEGVNAGGNQSGIPTPQGFVYFDERYRGKPLVFVGTVGLIPKKINGIPSHIKKALPGDLIVMIGGRVGKDGIHGATFSSEVMDSASPATAVQIGDPITQKKLSDAIVKEARDAQLYNSITDNGAGGLSCSVAEMGREAGGCRVDLEKVPLKYPGLDPWEIWISESQERMTLAVPEKSWKKFKDLMDRRGVEATVIGEFTESSKCVVQFNKRTIMDIDMDFLHEGLPQRPMHSQEMKIIQQDSIIPEPEDINKSFIGLLKRQNIASYAFITRQFDHIVQSSLVLPPMQGCGQVNADASVIRPVLNSQNGVILAQGLYPTYTEIDPYAMAAASIDTAVRNAVAAGADPDYLSLLDNFCWCSANEPERLFQLKLAAKACYDIAVAYGTPFISGKDSMFNDFNGYDKKGNQLKISVLPTLLISSFGVIKDITKTVSLDAKQPEDLVYMLGDTYGELAGSEYAVMENIQDSHVPKVHAVKNLKLYRTFYNAVQKNLVASSISVGRGGLATALAKKAIGGMLGVEVNLAHIPGDVARDDFALFSESQGRIVATIISENKTAFEKLMKGNAVHQIGKVTKKPNLVIQGINGKEIINVSLPKLQNAYTKTFKDY